MDYNVNPEVLVHFTKVIERLIVESKKAPEARKEYVSKLSHFSFLQQGDFLNHALKGHEIMALAGLKSPITDNVAELKLLLQNFGDEIVNRLLKDPSFDKDMEVSYSEDSSMDVSNAEA